MESNKKIIAIALGLFLISAIYLSWIETRQADYNLDKNWWTLSFSDPKSGDLSFTVENHSDQETFHWAVFTAGKTKLSEGEVNIRKGEKNEIDLSGLETKTTKRIIIDVNAGNDKK